MNRSESKYLNTAIKMDKAFLELLHEKEFTDISIMEICKRADVTRSTFYSHYDNTYDLLRESQNYIMREFWKSFDGKTIPKDMNSVPKERLNFISPEYLVPYLQFIKRNKFLFRVYMQNIHNFDSAETSEFFLKEVFIPVSEQFRITDKKVINYMMNYYLSGITAVVAEWVKHDCIDDIMFMCEIINICVRPFPIS